MQISFENDSSRIHVDVKSFPLKKTKTCEDEFSSQNVAPAQ